MSKQATDLTYNWTGYQLGRNVKVSIGDVDGDNRLEVIATCCGHSNNSAILYLFDWDGRTFVEQSRISLGAINSINTIKAGRFTGRNSDDIIIVTDNYFFIYQMQNNNMRRIYQSPYLGGAVMDLEIKNVTGQGTPQLVVSIAGVGVHIYQWSENRVIQLTTISHQGKVRVAVGDTNGTGIAEVVVLKYGEGAGRDVVEIYSFAKGQLVLTARIPLEVMAFGSIKTGRLTSSREEQIVIATDSGRRILVLGWDGAGYNRITLSESFSRPVREMVIGDWDNEGNRELLVGTTNSILVWRLDKGKLTLIETIDTPNPLSGLRMADLNASGRQELVIGTDTGSVHFCRKTIEIVVKARPPIIVVPKPQPIIEPVAQFLVTETVEVPPKFPDVIKVASVKAKPIVTKVNVITNKVIVSGFFEVDILVVVEPDRRVLAFSTKIPFVHFVHIQGLTPRDRVKVDVEVVYADFRFNPSKPRQIEVIIVAEIFVFDYIVRPRDTLSSLADQWKTDTNVIIGINKLVSREVTVGQKLKMPVT